MIRTVTIISTALTGLVLAACASESPPAPTASTAAATTGPSVTSTVAPASPAPSSTAASPAAGAATASPSATAHARVSANNATREQLQAAFEAAGISGPSGWAREVVEYRPYPTNDANLPKLRQNLAKYNPGPGVVDAIVATLSLP